MLEKLYVSNPFQQTMTTSLEKLSDAQLAPRSSSLFTAVATYFNFKSQETSVQTKSDRNLDVIFLSGNFAIEN